MSGYSIFDHAQWGHIQSQDRTKREKVKVRVEVVSYAEAVSRDEAVRDQQRRPARGWAVELGLGLGPRFNKR